MSKHKQYFGTDGIRGRVGTDPITPDFMLKLGFAAGCVFANQKTHTVLIGKDTRISGYMFESALEAGLSAAGVNIGLLGVMPTPGIAYLTQKSDAVAGIVISASHNPYVDNGIKFFCRDGQKLSDEIELAIEAQLAKPIHIVAPDKLGKAHRVVDAVAQYQQFCKDSCDNQSLSGLTIVLDCANGANYHVAPELFKALGATVHAIHYQPNGLNINVDCGSTAIKSLLYILAKYRKGVVGVVGTLMSNLGLAQSLEKLNIAFERAGVGDRYVLEKLKQKKYILGGEPSGHMICLDKTPTGDGIIAALQVLQVMVQQEKALHDLYQDMLFYPQTLINVRIEKNQDVLNNPEVLKAIQSAEQQLNNKGRVLLRASGTEPVVRVMVEGEDLNQVNVLAQSLADVLHRS
jgi:phosphoglucosamine mutase